ncbi:MAG: NAD(P)H-dependent oxidoreductase [Desulfitobacteriaceae bacterium]
MNTLIIYAHPNKKSFNHVILEQVKRGLKDGNHTFTVIDLYEENFNPVLIFNEQIKRSELANNIETEHYRELVRQADHLIFIYPIWWYGTPAILKGFLDRVFVSGFAYTNKGKLPKGLLGDKSAWVVYTIDSPSWFVRLFRRNVEWKVMSDAILKYCGIKRIKRMMFAGVKNSSPERRQKWLDYVYEHARTKL